MAHSQRGVEDNICVDRPRTHLVLLQIRGAERRAEVAVRAGVVLLRGSADEIELRVVNVLRAVHAGIAGVVVLRGVVGKNAVVVRVFDDGLRQDVRNAAVQAALLQPLADVLYDGCGVTSLADVEEILRGDYPRPEDHDGVQRLLGGRIAGAAYEGELGDLAGELGEMGEVRGDVLLQGE